MREALKDEEIREMLLKSGFDVTVAADVDSFARFIRAMFAIHETRIQRAANRRTWIVAVITALLTTSIPIILKFFKVL